MRAYRCLSRSRGSFATCWPRSFPWRSQSFCQSGSGRWFSAPAFGKTCPLTPMYGDCVLGSDMQPIIEEISQSWGWIGISPVEVVGENDFGNLMIKDAEGRYWRLCPEDLYCKIVASDRKELDDLSKNQEFLHDWHMRAMVER